MGKKEGKLRFRAL